MRALVAALALIPASPAIAQDHSGHSMPVEESAPDPHADHVMPMEEAAPDPHAGHVMPMEGAAPDPHAGHVMPMEEPDPHAGHTMPMGQSGSEAAPPQAGPPPEAFSGPDHAADTLFPPSEMAATRDTLRRNQGGQPHSFIGVDRLEAQIADGANAYLWETNAWFGSDLDRLWIKTEGEGEFGGAVEQAEVQALWSHAIGPYFDLQTGIRYDIRPSPDRAHAVIGVQGLSPYFFELDAAAFISSEGDITARFEAEYDQRITQRLILQPRAELSFAAQDILEYGIGAGLSDLEMGVRLRYEITPQFAPYIGTEWQKQFGGTADFTRTSGGDPDRWVWVMGLRAWF